MKRLLHFSLVLTATFCPLVCTVYGEAPPYVVKKDDAPDSKLFPEIQKEARRLDQLAINAIVVPTRQSVQEGFPAEGVPAFGKLVQTDVSKKLSSIGLPKLDPQLAYFGNLPYPAGEGFPKKLPEFKLPMMAPLPLAR
ncbi:MAG: hypothetical protein QM760_01475 [Nibricoccus sp.]